MEREPLSIGLMVPANNTTMEPELLAWLPEDSSCRIVRIPRGKGMLTPDTLPDYLAQAVALAKELADPDIDIVVYGCTAAGFIAGPARDAEVAMQLAAITKKRVVTTASSMNAVLKEIGAHRIALITPYLDAVNERLKSFLHDDGISVEAFSSFYAKTVDELAAITSAQVAERAREIIRPGLDALFIACSQLPTHAIIPELERDLKMPVWSSIRATAWQAVRAHAGAPASPLPS
jgi:maleate cis-trans isomerase